MASTHILVVGKMRNGSSDLRVALPPKTDDSVLAAIDFGRRLFESGASRSACITEDEGIGYDEAEWEAYQEVMMGPRGLPEAEHLLDGKPLQQLIDEAAELEELIEGMEDEEWHRRGQW